jgi:serine phosphatase RsbU (regulator of sigma subunit)
MCRKLPVGLFCSALILKLDLAAGQLFVWQGGMPDAYFLNTNGDVIKTLASNNLPLGIDADSAFGNHTSCHALSDAASLFVYSDGVTEQIGHDETMFSETRLRSALRHTPPGCRRVDNVVSKLRAHQNGLVQTDDVSLFELNLQRLCQALEHP